VSGRHRDVDLPGTDAATTGASALPAEIVASRVPEPRRQPADQSAGRPRRIRTRLTVVLAIPLVILLTLAGLALVVQFREYRWLDQARGTVSLVAHTDRLIHELQDERSLSNAIVVAGEGLKDSKGVTAVRGYLPDERTETDKALRELKTTLADNKSVPGAAEVRAALDAMKALGDVRDDVDVYPISAKTNDFYAESLRALIDATKGLDQIERGDKQMRDDIEALHAATELTAATDSSRMFLVSALVVNSITQAELDQLRNVLGQRWAAYVRFQELADPHIADRISRTLSRSEVVTAGNIENRVTSAKPGQTLNIDLASLWEAGHKLATDIRDAQGLFHQRISDRVDTLRDNAVRQLLTVAGLALLAVVLTIVLIAITSRSITKPLAALRAAADDIAGRQLPDTIAQIQSGGMPSSGQLEPLPLAARDSSEISDVAASLDNLRSTAVRLATEQALLRQAVADSLVNLGRRNQNLVRRQLGFISQLERTETDPSTLANLFELDHLATRMRRNAESLLVLGGEDPPRRWWKPIPIAEVIRSAISEVEDYQRVVLRDSDDMMIVGTAAAELGHLLAELIENGLASSPPETEVGVYARGNHEQYVIAVVDVGVGMDQEALARANARLRGAEPFTVTSTRYLGHYVVARLAQRLGAWVQLHESSISGITAKVVLPSQLLVLPTMIEAPHSGAGINAISGQYPTVVEAPYGAEQIGGPPQYAGTQTIDLTDPNGMPAMPATTYPAGAPGSPASPGHAPFAPDPADAPKTHAGLTRRVPGTHLPRGQYLDDPVTAKPAPSQAQQFPDEWPAPGPDPSGAFAQVDDPSGAFPRAEGVRHMLSSFRSGVHQGRDEEPAQDPSMTDPYDWNRGQGPDDQYDRRG
jgi:signal transduction histidine kinase